MKSAPFRIAGIIMAALAVMAAATAYYIFDPAESVWAPKCMFHIVTGWECPGCGSQRMLHALMHGNLKAAWEANAFLLCATPILALVAFSAIFRTRLPGLYRRVNSLPSIIIIAVALVAWTIGRNVC